MSGPELAGLLLPLGVAALRQATPLVLAGLGGICSERVGIVNIALEGMMLAGAFTGLVAGRLAGPLVGVLAAVTVGMLVGLTHLWATRKLRLNHIVSGVAINLLALHSTTFLLRRLFNQADPPVEAEHESRGAQVAVGDPLLGRSVEGPADIDSDNQGLGRSEASAPVKEFPK